MSLEWQLLAWSWVTLHRLKIEQGGICKLKSTTYNLAERVCVCACLPVCLRQETGWPGVCLTLRRCHPRNAWRNRPSRFRPQHHSWKICKGKPMRSAPAMQKKTTCHLRATDRRYVTYTPPLLILQVNISNYGWHSGLPRTCCLAHCDTDCTNVLWYNLWVCRRPAYHPAFMHVYLKSWFSKAKYSVHNENNTIFLLRRYADDYTLLHLNF